MLGVLIRSGSLLAGRMLLSRQGCRLLWYLVKIQCAADNAGAEFRLQSDTCGDEIPHLQMYSLNDGAMRLTPDDKPTVHQGPLRIADVQYVNVNVLARC